MRLALLSSRLPHRVLSRLSVCAFITLGGCGKQPAQPLELVTHHQPETHALHNATDAGELKLLDTSRRALTLPAPVEFDFADTQPLHSPGEPTTLGEASVLTDGPSLIEALPPLPAELDEAVYGRLPALLPADSDQYMAAEGRVVAEEDSQDGNPAAEASPAAAGVLQDSMVVKGTSRRPQSRVGLSVLSPQAQPSPQVDSDITPLKAAGNSEQSAQRPGRAFAAEEFDDDAELAATTSADDVLAYFPAEQELSSQLQPRVQQAFTLARNGALHAARASFEQLLGELAQAKDASQMTDRFSRSLAAGLRALEEADDFLSAGGGSNTDTIAIAAGHQTPMFHQSEEHAERTKWTLPHEAIASYHLYAQQKLAAATDGEKAGSMVLFGLGKIYAQLADRGEDTPQAIRKSLTMYRSAVVATPDNYLAANEAGVLLARSGRYRQSAQLLELAVKQSNASTTHTNLAFVHEKLGSTRLANQHRAQASRMASHERASGQMSAERGIAWVSPEEFNRHGVGVGPARVASRPAPAATPQQSPPTQAVSPQASPPQSPPQQAIPQRTLWW